MNIQRAFLIAAIFLSIVAIDVEAQKAAAQPAAKPDVPAVAKGEFDVKVTPMPAEENVGDAKIGRLSLEKKYTGGLVGISKGQMLGSQSEAEPGKGGYVAMERFVGTLDGMKGGFMLQHSGTMDANGAVMSISVVPGTGEGELKGITGKCTIIIKGDKHFYEFEYSLPKRN